MDGSKNFSVNHFISDLSKSSSNLAEMLDVDNTPNIRPYSTIRSTIDPEIVNRIINGIETNTTLSEEEKASLRVRYCKYPDKLADFEEVALDTKLGLDVVKGLIQSGLNIINGKTKNNTLSSKGQQSLPFFPKRSNSVADVQVAPKAVELLAKNGMPTISKSNYFSKNNKKPVVGSDLLLNATTSIIPLKQEGEFGKLCPEEQLFEGFESLISSINVTNGCFDIVTNLLQFADGLEKSQNYYVKRYEIVEKIESTVLKTLDFPEKELLLDFIIDAVKMERVELVFNPSDNLFYKLIDEEFGDTFHNLLYVDFFCGVIEGLKIQFMNEKCTKNGAELNIAKKVIEALESLQEAKFPSSIGLTFKPDICYWIRNGLEDEMSAYVPNMLWYIENESTFDNISGINDKYAALLDKYVVMTRSIVLGNRGCTSDDVFTILEPEFAKDQMNAVFNGHVINSLCSDIRKMHLPPVQKGMSSGKRPSAS